MRFKSRPSVEAAKPVVLVTGCGAGIGFELARLLYADHDMRVVITARTKSLPRLRALFPTSERVQVCELDVTNDTNIYQVINNVCCEWGRIDVIVNNAAVCFRGVVEHMDSESEMLQLKTNYLGPMTLVRAVLPIMREQRAGQIINISSVSGMLAMPTMASYSASKHALEGASEALWYEARPFGIRVNLVELGFVNSPSYKNVIFAKKAQVSSALGGPQSEYYKAMSPFIERLMSLSLTTPEAIARKVVKTIRQRPRQLRISATPDVLFFSFVRRVLPSYWFNRLCFLLLPGSVRWGGKWRFPRPSFRSTAKLGLNN